MKIIKIYNEYELPVLLKNHMLRTAAVGAILAESWTGPQIEPENIIITMLFHDIGNMAKISVDNELHQNDTVAEKEKLAKQKEEFVARYGDDAQSATENIVKELGLPERICKMIAAMPFRKNHETVAVDDYSVKICAYSDQLVSPYGVTTLKERLEEATKRYHNNFPKLPDGITSELLISDAFKIEEQVLRHTKLEIEKVEEYKERFKDFEIDLEKHSEFAK